MANAQFSCQQSADYLLLTGLGDQWRVKAVLEAIFHESPVSIPSKFYVELIQWPLFHK